MLTNGAPRITRNLVFDERFAHAQNVDSPDLSELKVMSDTTIPTNKRVMAPSPIDLVSVDEQNLQNAPETTREFR